MSQPRSQDWHELSAKASLTTTAIAGALTSAFTKTLLFPIDTVKCRIQSGLNPFVFKGIMNGLFPKIALYAPYQGVYMSVYTRTREWLNPDPRSVWKFAFAGVVAELSGSVIRVPMETIKQRMQTGSIPSNRDLFRILAADPLQFYRYRNFLAQTLVHDIPGGIIHWTVYEYVKRHTTGNAATSGAISGVMVAVLTNPMDVVKTRMITRPDEHKTVSSTIKFIMAGRGNGGIGFFSGVIPRILHIAPNSALYMFIFDAMFRSIERLRSN
jgi:solute carrier family 25 S-adenosylmethionine transporter 26